VAALATALTAALPPGAVLAVSPDTATAGGPPAKVIVTFRAHPGKAAEQAIVTAGGHVRFRFTIIPALAATVPAQAIEGLRHNPFVKAVEADGQVTILGDDTPTGDLEYDNAWGVRHIGTKRVHDSGDWGEGVKVAIIDSGIDYVHYDLSGPQPVYPEFNGNYRGGWDFVNNDADPIDDNGHGTHVAGILAADKNGYLVVGVAPQVELYSLKVVDASGNGEYSSVIAALQWAVDHGIDVVNMSIGGHEASQALADAVEAAYRAHVLMVAAAGNVNPMSWQEVWYGCPVVYPAAYPHVLATTYTNPTDSLTGFSCTGPEVDFAAPGDQVFSPVPVGTCMFCSPYGYQALSGTSMASPHLAGVVALVLSHGIRDDNGDGLLFDEVKAHLCATTDPGGRIPTTDPRYPSWYGCGVIDAGKALVDSPPPPDTAADQSINFGTLSARTYGFAPFTVSATASSGLPVSFTASGACTVTGTTVTITGAGTCTITASQGGGASWNPAPSVERSFTIARATPVITWADPAAITYGTALSATQLDATASSPGTFAYSPDLGTVLDAGSRTLGVAFTPTDTANYTGASTTVLITVDPAGSTVTVSCPASQVYTGSPIAPCTAEATGAGMLPVDVSATLVYGNNLAFGTATADAAWAGDLNHNASSGSGSFEIVPGPLDRLVVSPATATIGAGGSQAYGVEGFDSFGNSLGDVTATTTFSISAAGSCTGATCAATSAGQHTVTATNDGKTATATLTVIPGPLDHLVLIPPSASITANGSQTYAADGRDAFDNSLGTQTGVAYTISPNGTCSGSSCTAKIAGAHSVTGTKSGKTGSAALTVNPGPLHHLVLSPTGATVLADTAQAYTAEGRDIFDNSLGDLTPGTVFTIAPNGACTGSSCRATFAGTHTVTGTKSGKTGNTTLTVNPGPLDHLSLSPASASIAFGGAQTYGATGRDAFDNSLGTQTGVTYTIGPDGSCSGAKCTPAAAGPHTVTGTKSGTTGTASLAVTMATPTLTYTGSTAAVTGAPLTLSATLKRPGGAAIAGASISFTVNGQITTVTTNASGVASVTSTAPATAGTYAISVVFAGDASFNSASASKNLVVSRPVTALAYTGTTSAARGGLITLSGRLRTSSGVGISGATVSFTLASVTRTAVTDATGVAAVAATAPASLGTFTVTVKFAGDSTYAPASVNGSLKVL
jgi:subtilisin